MDIVRASNADLGDVVRLLRAQLDEHAITTSTERVENAVAGMLADPVRGLILVAREASVVVGVAYVSFNWSLEHGGRSSWLEEIYVVPARRGAGIGQALLREAIDGAEKAGCAAMDLDVERGHERAAGLYERAGFVHHTRARMVRGLNGIKPPVS